MRLSELQQGSPNSRSSLIDLRFAKSNKLQERAFEPIRKGWLAVTKLGEKGSCGDFGRTEQRLWRQGDDESILERCQLLDRQVIHIIEVVSVETTTLLGKL